MKYFILVIFTLVFLFAADAQAQAQWKEMNEGTGVVGNPVTSAKQGKIYEITLDATFSPALEVGACASVKIVGVALTATYVPNFCESSQCNDPLPCRSTTTAGVGEGCFESREATDWLQVTNGTIGDRVRVHCGA